MATNRHTFKEFKKAVGELTLKHEGFGPSAVADSDLNFNYFDFKSYHALSEGEREALELSITDIDHLDDNQDDLLTARKTDQFLATPFGPNDDKNIGIMNYDSTLADGKGLDLRREYLDSEEEAENLDRIRKEVCDLRQEGERKAKELKLLVN